MGTSPKKRQEKKNGKGDISMREQAHSYTVPMQCAVYVPFHIHTHTHTSIRCVEETRRIARKCWNQSICIFNWTMVFKYSFHEQFHSSFIFLHFLDFSLLFLYRLLHARAYVAAVQCPMPCTMHTVYSIAIAMICSSHCN